MKKILFLGYDKKSTKLIDEMKFFNKKFHINQNDKIISLEQLQQYDLLISFGYKHLISETVINKIKKPIINLHISYLPYNRGSHPNFWSFAENTPAGVSIHTVDKGIDTGNLIFQKPIDFELSKNKTKLTFKNTYKILMNEIENLFLYNIEKIVNYDFVSYKQIGKGTYHANKDLPKLLKNWEQNIYQTVLEYKKLNK